MVKSPQTSASVETEDGSGLAGLGGAGAMVRAKCHDCCQRMVEWSQTLGNRRGFLCPQQKREEGVGALDWELGGFPTDEAPIHSVGPSRFGW